MFARDVTLLRDAQSRLRDAEAHANVAVQAARLGTWSFDPGSGELVWNARHRELFGLRPDASVDFGVLMRGIHPDDRALVEAAVRAATDPDGGGELAVDYRAIGAGLGTGMGSGGEPRWLAAHGRSMFEDGRCVRITGTVQDITERRRGEAALRDSEARFRAITEASPMIVFVTDAAGANTYTNPQYSEFTGIRPSALLGDGWTAAVYPRDLDAAAAAWSAAVRDGKPYRAEFRLRRHDGVPRWFLALAMPLRRPDAPEQGVEQWLGTCTDIQELVDARHLLARDRDELERLVDERSNALQSSLRTLHDREARLRAVFENSHDYQLLLRDDLARGFVYLDLNARAAALLVPRARAGDRPHGARGADPRPRRGRDRAALPPRARHRRRALPLRGASDLRGRHARSRGHRAGVRGARRRAAAADLGARRDRAARARGGAAPEPEDGGRGPAHWRHRARLQQPAGGHLGQPRADAGPRGRGPSSTASNAMPPPRWDRCGARRR